MQGGMEEAGIFFCDLELQVTVILDQLSSPQAIAKEETVLLVILPSARGLLVWAEASSQRLEVPRVKAAQVDPLP
jgi:hypothetical protein